MTPPVPSKLGPQAAPRYFSEMNRATQDYMRERLYCAIASGDRTELQSVIDDFQHGPIAKDLGAEVRPWSLSNSYLALRQGIQVTHSNREQLLPIADGAAVCLIDKQKRVVQVVAEHAWRYAAVEMFAKSPSRYAKAPVVAPSVAEERKRLARDLPRKSEPLQRSDVSPEADFTKLASMIHHYESHFAKLDTVIRKALTATTYREMQRMLKPVAKALDLMHQLEVRGKQSRVDSEWFRVRHGQIQERIHQLTAKSSSEEL